MAATATVPNGNGNTTAVAKIDPTEMTYTPFGDKTAIKLNVQIVQSLVSAKTASGQVASREECIKFMMLCRARGLNPFEGDAFLIGYDSKDGPKFSLVTAHQAFLKRAEMHPEYDGMESGVIVRDKDGNLVDREGDFVFDDDYILGGWATVHFKGRKYPMRKRAKLATYTTGRSRWAADPAGMIVKVAEADALRSSFPTLLGGCYSQEERSDIIDAVAVAPPAPLTPGRTHVGRKAKVEQPPAVIHHEEEPPQNTTFDDDPAEGEILPVDDMEADDIAQNLIDAIENAMTKKVLETIGGDVKAALPRIGEARHGEVMAAWRKKFAGMK